MAINVDTKKVLGSYAKPLNMDSDCLRGSTAIPGRRTLGLTLAKTFVCMRGVASATFGSGGKILLVGF